MKRVVILLMLLCPTVAICQARGTQVAQELNKEIKKTIKMGYLLYLPNEYGKEKEKKWPLILFLHGAGETGTDIEKVKKHGPPKLVSEGKEMPFIVVSPQWSGPGFGWNSEALGYLLDEIQGKLSVDLDRVYLTGLSMGGFGTWQMAQDFPNRFAAIAPICGGGQPNRARRIRHIPIWVFHGAKDTTVPLKSSEEMVDALKAANAPEVKFTVYPEAGHDSWTETYNNKDLYTWFLEHKRQPAPAAAK